MSDWSRPLAYAGLQVLPASLLIVSDHPWVGAGAFVVVLAATLTHSRRRLGAAAAHARRQLPSARPAPLRETVPAGSGGGTVPVTHGGGRSTADGEERPLRAHDEQVIHFPPRRLPL